MKIPALSPVLIAAIIAGCSSQRRVYSGIDARTENRVTFAPGAISIAPAAKDDRNPLEYREYAERLTRALTAKGWRIVPAAPGVPVLRFLYKIDDGKVVGYSSSSVATGSVWRSGNGVFADAQWHGSASAQISYSRYIGLRAYGEQDKLLWTVDVGSSGSDGNIRNVIPYLTISAAHWAGRQNSKTKRFITRESDVIAVYPEFAKSEVNPWEPAAQE